MKDYPAREIWRNFFSVVAGALAGLLLVAFFSVFIYGFSALAEKWWGKILFMICFLIAPTILAGYITASISTRKDILHVIITGLILILFVLINEDFRFETNSFEDLLPGYSVLLLTIIGGLLGIYRKKKRKATSNTKSSPPGSPLQ